MEIEVIFTDSSGSSSTGKLAEVELHFHEAQPGECCCGGAGETDDQTTGAKVACTMCAGSGMPLPSPLAGLKLIGFAIWERRGGGRNVTFPARVYSVNGERRSFALLRPVRDADATETIRSLILEAYSRLEKEQR
jgi:hypothetical protein